MIKGLFGCLSIKNKELSENTATCVFIKLPTAVLDKATFLRHVFKIKQENKHDIN